MNNKPGHKILLVATNSKGCTRLCQGMRRMSKAQSQYTSKEGTLEPYYTRNRCLTLPDDSHGLYCQASTIRRL
jgi:hypothetical protein